MRFIYSIKDVLAGFGSIPGVPMLLDLPNDDVAKRVVSDSCANGAKPNALNTHPEHKELWRLGKIDEETGVITPLDPVCVARAIDYIGVISVKEKEGIEDEAN